MKEKKIFIYLVITWFTLLGIYIYLEKTGVEPLKRVEKIFEIEKKIPRIGIEEAQLKIDTLLSTHPITFPEKVSSFDANQSYTKENAQVLNSVVSIIKRVDSNIFTKIEVHSSLKGSNSNNRILSQKRADTVQTFIKSVYPAIEIDAIGYGEEFPLPVGKRGITNQRIEITLQPLIPKI